MSDRGKLANARISYMLFESKEIRPKRASGMSEVPKTPPKDKVNSKEVGVEKLINAGLRSCPSVSKNSSAIVR
jgi:hypothetical protein